MLIPFQSLDKTQILPRSKVPTGLKGPQRLPEQHWGACEQYWGANSTGARVSSTGVRASLYY